MQSSDEEVKKQVENALQRMMDETEIVFVPDKNDPFNLDKTMVYFIRDDPYANMFIKLEPK